MIWFLMGELKALLERKVLIGHQTITGPVEVVHCRKHLLCLFVINLFGLPFVKDFQVQLDSAFPQDKQGQILLPILPARPGLEKSICAGCGRPTHIYKHKHPFKNVKGNWAFGTPCDYREEHIIKMPLCAHQRCSSLSPALKCHSQDPCSGSYQNCDGKILQIVYKK